MIRQSGRGRMDLEEAVRQLYLFSGHAIVGGNIGIVGVIIGGREIVQSSGGPVGVVENVHGKQLVQRQRPLNYRIIIPAAIIPTAVIVPPAANDQHPGLVCIPLQNLQRSIPVFGGDGLVQWCGGLDVPVAVLVVVERRYGGGSGEKKE